jgi:hypothetical protein
MAVGTAVGSAVGIGVVASGAAVHAANQKVAAIKMAKTVKASRWVFMGFSLLKSYMRKLRYKVNSSLSITF